MKLWRLVAPAALAALLAGCDGSGATGTAQADPAPPPAPVKIQRATTQDFEHSLTAYGTVEFSPRGAHSRTIQAEARVAEVRVSVGEPVAPGTLLMVLEPTANARLELEKARIDVDFARRELARVQGLYDRQLATNSDLGTAQKGVATAEATVENVRRREVGEHDRQVRSSVSGVVIALDVKPGQVVGAGTELLRIGDRARLDVRLGIEQEDLASVKPGDRVEIRALNSPTTRGTRISRVDGQLDPKTGLADALAPLSAGPGLLPGAMVRGRIVVGTDRGAVVVPRASVVYIQAKPCVFVVDGSRARLRHIAVAGDDGRIVEVREGVKAGEPVVVEGSAELKDGDMVRVEGGA